MGSQAIAAHPPSLTTHVADEFPATLVRSIAALQEWVEQREFAGYEPFDILNSPQLQGRWAYWWPAAILLIQFSKRYAGLGVRSWLRVPESKNAKAMGLFLSAYCDLARCGEDSWDRAAQLKMELKQLRSPGEAEFCWGYDWEHVSRAGRMPAFSPNCVATCFCAQALLDMAEVFGDVEALKMAESAARFIVTRLNRSVDMPEHLCFSYTTRDHMKVYNASAMAGALLARMAPADAEYAPMARRVMNYLASNQRPDGSWYYGASLAHRWIDGFHTAYNLLALLDYQRSMKDDTFDKAIRGGYRYYVNNFFSTDGAPKYFHNSLYPIDIHSCSQAILTFCSFEGYDANGLDRATAICRWTLNHMRNANGTFFYQAHRFWTNRTPYMRWGQAWMMHALTRLKRDCQFQVRKAGHGAEVSVPARVSAPSPELKACLSNSNVPIKIRRTSCLPS